MSLGHRILAIVCQYRYSIKNLKLFIMKESIKNGKSHQVYVIIDEQGLFLLFILKDALLD